MIEWTCRGKDGEDVSSEKELSRLAIIVKQSKSAYQLLAASAADGEIAGVDEGKDVVEESGRPGVRQLLLAHLGPRACPSDRQPQGKMKTQVPSDLPSQRPVKPSPGQAPK